MQTYTWNDEAVSGGGYVAAPATELVATNCACCGRPLLDAVSVETGMGPVCRRRHGYAEAQGEADWDAYYAACAGTPAEWMSNRALAALQDRDAHTLANVLVHRIACVQQGPHAQAYTNCLRALGYAKLAGRIVERLASVVIEEQQDGRLAVLTPYSQEVVAAMRAVPGRRWDAEAKRNTFPASSRVHVWRLLRRFYAGCTGMGPKGLFTIPAAGEVAA